MNTFDYWVLNGIVLLNQSPKDRKSHTFLVLKFSEWIMLHSSRGSLVELHGKIQRENMKNHLFIDWLIKNNNCLVWTVNEFLLNLKIIFHYRPPSFNITVYRLQQSKTSSKKYKMKSEGNWENWMSFRPPPSLSHSLWVFLKLEPKKYPIAEMLLKRKASKDCRLHREWFN